MQFTKSPVTSCDLIMLDACHGSTPILAALAKPPGLFEDRNPSSRLPEAPGLRLHWSCPGEMATAKQLGMFCKVHLNG